MFQSDVCLTQDVAGKKFVRQYVEVEYGALRLALDQEGVRADAAIGLLHLAHTDAGAPAATKGTAALRCACAWPQEAFREGDARQEACPELGGG